MRDDDPMPPTLAEVQEHTDGIFCWCHRCDHNAVLPVAVLIAHCGPGLPFPAVHGRLRCQACGSKDIHARPHWKGLGVVARHETRLVDNGIVAVGLCPIGDREG